MCDNDHGCSVFLTHQQHFLNYLFLYGYIQGTGRLICQKKRRILQHGNTDSHTLIHAAGQFKGIALQNTFPILEANLSHHPDGTLRTLFTTDPFMLPHTLIDLIAHGADGTKGCS